MFEKEAEEYQIANSDYSKTDSIADAFQEGAEFGYNKANEWHYVKDGEYPKDESKVLCILGDIANENCEVGYYFQGKQESNKRWCFENYNLPDNSEEDWGVSAWKEIVLPELPKESK